jgi:hypothetical protein
MYLLIRLVLVNFNWKKTTTTHKQFTNSPNVSSDYLIHSLLGVYNLASSINGNMTVIYIQTSKLMVNHKRTHKETNIAN